MSEWLFVAGALVFGGLMFWWSAKHPPKPISEEDDAEPEPVPVWHRLVGGATGIAIGLAAFLVLVSFGFRASSGLFQACAVPAMFALGYSPKLVMTPFARLWAAIKGKAR